MGSYKVQRVFLDVLEFFFDRKNPQKLPEATFVPLPQMLHELQVLQKPHRWGTNITCLSNLVLLLRLLLSFGVLS